MYCKKCGTKLDDNVSFCFNCGERVDNILNNNVNSSLNNVNNNVINNSVQVSKPTPSNKDNNTLKVIIVLLVFIVIGMFTFLVIKKLAPHENPETILTGGSRTVMIYASPTNLESEVEAATTDLSTLSGEEVDLDNLNILLYTGGTKKWHNFIKNDENAIYILKKDGFEKLESYEQKNMSDADTLQDFLDYCYENYKTDHYDLIVYDHGNALDGAVVDDFNPNDIITVSEFEKALSNSPFKKNNKLELILFRACLMGNIEVASTLAPYANYLVASEEVIWMGKIESVLDFLNDVEVEDTAIDFSKKYISSYEDFMGTADPFDDYLSCYSIIDLSKIEAVYKELEKFFDSIDVKDNYSNISKIRANIHQFAEVAGSNYIDTIDLYDFVNQLAKYSDYDKTKVLDALDNAIIFNWSNKEDINGLSIYFPYKGSAQDISYYLKVYDDLEIGEKYKSFINKFSNYKLNGSSKSLISGAVVNKETQVEGNEFSLQLTDEQINEYAHSRYLVVRKMNDEYYMPVFYSDNATLTDDGILKTNITNKIIKLKDVVHDGQVIDDAYLQVFDVSEDGEEKYLTLGTISNFENGNFIIDQANYYFGVKDNKPFISSVTSKSAEQPQGIIINPKDYTHYEFMTYWYKMFDDNGNYMTDWQGYSTYYGYEGKIDEVDFEFTSLDGTGEYYCLFMIYDIYGKSTVSSLIKLD